MRKQILILLLLLSLPLLAGCGAAAAQSVAPTPTAMPPAAELERPTYSVQRGAIERAVEATGRVSPVDLERLSFRVSGRVAAVYVRRGDPVKAGDLLAEILHEEALEALRRAEVGLAQAERDLEAARARGEREVAQAQINLGAAQGDLAAARANSADARRAAERELRRAEEDLAALQSGGPTSLIASAERKLDQAGIDARAKKNAASEAKTRAEHAQIAASGALQTAQQTYSDAYWDRDWVQKYGTHPREKLADPTGGEERHRPLSDAEQRTFERAFADAERELRAAERAIELATRDLELAREAEQVAVRQADEQVALAQHELDLLRAGQGSAALAAAQRRVEDARLALETARQVNPAGAQAGVASASLALEAARQTNLDTELSGLEAARLSLENARRVVDEGRVIAPRDGTVIALGIGAGDSVEPYAPVVELADPTRLEVAADLSAEQLRELAEGLPAEVRLAARPDIAHAAAIRRLPAPYGSGGSGAVAEQDRSARFSLLGAAAATLELGAVARLRIVVERKADVLWLPPEAIRTFEGRRFVVLRDGARERRVPIRTGIETAERVEIRAGLAAGDVVVGQ